MTYIAQPNSDALVFWVLIVSVSIYLVLAAVWIGRHMARLRQFGSYSSYMQAIDKGFYRVLALSLPFFAVFAMWVTGGDWQATIGLMILLGVVAALTWLFRRLARAVMAPLIRMMDEQWASANTSVIFKVEPPQQREDRFLERVAYLFLLGLIFSVLCVFISRTLSPAIAAAALSLAGAGILTVSAFLRLLPGWAVFFWTPFAAGILAAGFGIGANLPTVMTLVAAAMAAAGGAILALCLKRMVPFQ